MCTNMVAHVRMLIAIFSEKGTKKRTEEKKNKEPLNSSFIDESSCEGHYSDKCPYISQSFSSDIEPYNFYASFTKKNGFSIRCGHLLESREHQLGFYKREFLLSFYVG